MSDPLLTSDSDVTNLQLDYTAHTHVTITKQNSPQTTDKEKVPS